MVFQCHYFFLLLLNFAVYVSSKIRIEKIARGTGFIKRKGKVRACEFVYLCCFMDVEVANNTLVYQVYGINILNE